MNWRITWLGRTSKHLKNWRRRCHPSSNSIWVVPDKPTKHNDQVVPSLLATGQKVAPATVVGTADAHKAADSVTANWHSSDAAPVEFAPTFNAFSQDVQDSVEQNQQAKTKGIYHPKSNTIWVVLDTRVRQLLVSY
jgi:hypothetical protein